MIMLFNGDLYSLLNFLSFARWLFIGLVVAGLIYLRYKRPDMPRPFKVTSALYSFTWILPPLRPVVRQQGSIFWCNKLTSFSGKTKMLRENSVFQWRLSFRAVSPVLPQLCSIPEKNSCLFPMLGGQRLKLLCWDEGVWSVLPVCCVQAVWCKLCENTLGPPQSQRVQTANIGVMCANLIFSQSSF